eukprot:2016278-Pyramimonas_sp.AAC.1
MTTRDGKEKESPAEAPASPAAGDTLAAVTPAQLKEMIVGVVRETMGAASSSQTPVAAATTAAEDPWLHGWADS